MSLSLLMAWLTAPFTWWLSLPWPLAFSSVLVFHIGVYLSGSAIATWMTFRLFPALGIGHPIDTESLKPRQIAIERRNGLVTCVVLAAMSMSYPMLADGIWPRNGWEAA